MRAEMTPPAASTPSPTVDEGMREAVAAWLIANDDATTSREIGIGLPWAVRFLAEHCQSEHAGDCPHVDRPSPITCRRCVCDDHLARADELLAGPIASALAARERERAQHMCPIGLDASPGICSDGSCYVCISARCLWATEALGTAEAENATLRASAERREPDSRTGAETLRREIEYLTGRRDLWLNEAQRLAHVVRALGGDPEPSVALQPAPMDSAAAGPVGEDYSKDFQLMLVRIIQRHRNGRDLTETLEGAADLLKRKGSLSVFRSATPTPDPHPTPAVEER